MKSSEVEEEEEEEESEGSVSGVGMVRVQNVTVDHKVNIASASCFCSAQTVERVTTPSVVFPPSTPLLFLSLNWPWWRRFSSWILG